MKKEGSDGARERHRREDRVHAEGRRTMTREERKLIFGENGREKRG